MALRHQEDESLYVEEPRRVPECHPVEESHGVDVDESRSAEGLVYVEEPDDVDGAACRFVDKSRDIDEP